MRKRRKNDPKTPRHLWLKFERHHSKNGRLRNKIKQQTRAPTIFSLCTKVFSPTFYFFNDVTQFTSRSAFFFFFHSPLSNFLRPFLKKSNLICPVMRDCRKGWVTEWVYIQERHSSRGFCGGDGSFDPSLERFWHQQQKQQTRRRRRKKKSQNDGWI